MYYIVVVVVVETLNKKVVYIIKHGFSVYFRAYLCFYSRLVGLLVLS